MKHELSKERLEKIASWRESYGAGHNVMLPAEEAEAMARALLAAHDQEPVSDIPAERFLTECLKPEEISGNSRALRIRALLNWFNRYYDGHANPKWLKAHTAELCYYILTAAPSIPAAVPEEATPAIIDMMARKFEWGAAECIAAFRSWNACRAAMLQAEPQSAPQNIPENIHAGLVEAVNRLLDSYGSRGCFDAIQCYDAHEEIERLLAAAPKSSHIRENANSSTEDFRENAETSTITPVDKWREEAERMAELHGTSFVVFRNGEEPRCADPTKVVISFTDKGLGHDIKSDSCWCHICRPLTMHDMRFVVCPDCGNKRCPKANDHRNECSGSNEPGQVGSAYPAAQKGV